MYVHQAIPILSLHFLDHPYITTFLIRRIFYFLVSFLFLLSPDCYDVINVTYSSPQSIWMKLENEVHPSYIVCASYEPIYVPIIIYCLQEAICCCLQTCSFDVIVMLMMFVYKVSTSSELIIMFKFYVSIIIYCLRVFVVVYM